MGNNTKNPEKIRDYKEENGRRIIVKTKAYKANIKKTRYLIYPPGNSILKPVFGG
jgi:hypothetical protein